LADDVPAELKEERAQAIMELQEQISAELNREKEGKILKVLFDRMEGDYFVGRTEADSPEVDNEVLVDAKKFFVRIGDFAKVKITGAEAFDLTGDVV
jgi:ribosomal protein S12 methylthiotransferase